LTISIVSGTAKVIAFGSAIANRSNDPTTFDMSYRNELLAGPPVATSVKHDGTLSGDGSDGAPLGVAGAASAAVGNVLTSTGSGGTAWQTPPQFALPYAASAASTSAAVGLFDVTNTASFSGSAISGHNATADGVDGIFTSGVGVRGISSSSSGVIGTSRSGLGVFATSDTGPPVQADSNHHIGLIARRQGSSEGDQHRIARRLERIECERFLRRRRRQHHTGMEALTVRPTLRTR